MTPPEKNDSEKPESEQTQASESPKKASDSSEKPSETAEKANGAEEEEPAAKKEEEGEAEVVTENGEKSADEVAAKLGAMTVQETQAADGDKAQPTTNCVNSEESAEAKD